MCATLWANSGTALRASRFLDTQNHAKNTSTQTLYRLQKLQPSELQLSERLAFPGNICPIENTPWNPPDNRSNILSRTSWGALNFSSIMPRGASFSASKCKLFQSGCVGLDRLMYIYILYIYICINRSPAINPSNIRLYICIYKYIYIHVYIYSDIWRIYSFGLQPPKSTSDSWEIDRNQILFS